MAKIIIELDEMTTISEMNGMLKEFKHPAITDIKITR